MKNRLLIPVLGAAMAVVACGPGVSDGADVSLGSGGPAGTGARTAATQGGGLFRRAYREVTIPAGTTLPLALTSSLASDRSLVEDAVTAELTRPIAIDGREVLPAGTRLEGAVTGVDGAGRVKGRAMIAFRFTSLNTGGADYDVRSAPLSRLASATKSEDATKIGIGAGAGAIIGGILGGKKGAATGAAVGGGAGTGVVLATKGQEIRLGPGADATTELTSPLTVRIRAS
jgi:hypothetical protein